MPRLPSILTAALLLPLAAAASAQPVPVNAVTVHVVGQAQAHRPDARAAALKDALRHAVEAGAGVRVASHSVTHHAQLTRDVVTVTAAGRVVSYAITAENPNHAGRYTLSLRAQVVPESPRAAGFTPAQRIRVVMQDQSPGHTHTAAYVAQRLSERGLNALPSDGPRQPHDATLALNITQRTSAAPHTYGLALVRADVSVTATLTPRDDDGNPSPPLTATTTRHAFGTTAAAAAGRAHQRALDAALQAVLPPAPAAAGPEPKPFDPPRNP